MSAMAGIRAIRGREDVMSAIELRRLGVFAVTGQP